MYQTMRTAGIEGFEWVHTIPDQPIRRRTPPFSSQCAEPRLLPPSPGTTQCRLVVPQASRALDPISMLH
jgi:hypothetical protein